jgi:signal transduction histidine kinase
MTSRSISRRLIAAVLLLELLAALALVSLSVFHESRIHFRTFDIMLHGRIDSLFGDVADAEDPADNVMLDLRGFTFPPNDLYSVEEDNGHILGRSSSWPAEELKSASPDQRGFYNIRFNGRNYRFIRMQGTRVVDPGDKNGGIAHHLTLYYGAPTERVWHEVREAARFYVVASLFLLTLTGLIMAWFLRRGLAPLRELATEAGRVSAQQWRFTPPESARTTRELSPLAHAIEAALIRLHQTFEQQKRFTSDAAHELKTDVAIVKSSIQLLAMRPRSVEEYQQGLELCISDCTRLENIVQEMLTLAGSQYAADQDDKTTTDISDLAFYASEALEKFTSLAELRRVHPTLAISGPTLVPLDAKDCNLLCSNLLLNAIQHSALDSEVHIELLSKEASLTMLVEDFGEGIAANVLPHVFAPFFRGDESRDRKSGGTGLGLAICKAICEKVGGTIEISSTPGAGTRVTVHLPTAQPNQPDRAVTPVVVNSFTRP